MKKIALCFLILLLVHVTVFAQNQPVTFVNNTGSNGLELYISHSTDSGWGQNRLTSNLNNGQSITLNIPVHENNLYDIWFAGSGDRHYVKMNVPISANTRIVITSDDLNPDGSPTTSVDSTIYNGPQQVTIVNNTGYLVLAVFTSPVISDIWGHNRLSINQVLNNGERITLNFPSSTGNRFDLMLVDLDGDSYVKQNIQVSANSTIEFRFSDFIGRQ